MMMMGKKEAKEKCFSSTSTYFLLPFVHVIQGTKHLHDTRDIFAAHDKPTTTLVIDG